MHDIPQSCTAGRWTAFSDDEMRELSFAFEVRDGECRIAPGSTEALLREQVDTEWWIRRGGSPATPASERCWPVDA